MILVLTVTIGILRLTRNVRIVLREIEAEDSLWHQKKTSQSQAEETHEPEKEKPKQPTQPKPSEGNGNETVKTETTKKLRFY